MISKILILIFRFTIYPYKISESYRKRLLNFIIPNISGLLYKRILFTKLPSCNQLTLITGKGTVDIGENCSFGYKLGGFHHGGSVEIQTRFPKAHIKIGNKVSTNNNLFLCAANLIEIGSETLIGHNVCVMDFEAHGLEPSKRNELGKIGTVHIGKNVWIGNSVTILKNSHIGDNSIVAAGVVVSGNYPDNVIIGGVPAKIIKSL